MMAENFPRDPFGSKYGLSFTLLCLASDPIQWHVVGSSWM